jgi:hypothetical protein
MQALSKKFQRKKDLKKKLNNQVEKIFFSFFFTQYLPSPSVVLQTNAL